MTYMGRDRKEERRKERESEGEWEGERERRECLWKKMGLYLEIIFNNIK